MNKSVIVTGGLGFIYSHYIELLLEKNYKVINIDKMSYCSNLDFHPNNPNYSFVHADIKDLKELPFCDFIVHAASESHVDNSLTNPDPFLNSNIIGTYNLLEILKNEKIKHMNLGWEHKYPTFIYVSTDEVVGSIKEGFFSENAPYNPANPYSCSKSCAELLVKTWSETYGIPYRITRNTNCYGPRQHPEKLVPHIITQLKNDEKVKVHGTGEYIRNWLYVLDACEAVLSVMENGKNGEIYHISSDEEYSVLQIVDMIAKKFGKQLEEVVEFVPNRISQDYRYALDSSKIKEELNWKQKYKMFDVLDEIIESYKK
ncbi:MAG: GDP-mannose 4,6-dehydratase [Nanoarchaeota archaeon]